MQVYSNFKSPVFMANNKSRIFILQPNTPGSSKPHSMVDLARINIPHNMLHKRRCHHKVLWKSNNSNKSPLSFSFYSKGIYFFSTVSKHKRLQDQYSTTTSTIC